MVMGMSPFDTEALVAKLSRDVYADGAQIKMSAMSSIEIACWDLVGKFLNSGVYNLGLYAYRLDGEVAPRVRDLTRDMCAQNEVKRVQKMRPCLSKFCKLPR